MKKTEMKKVMIVTSTRADYGLLRPVIRRVADSEKLSLCLIVTGTHLLENFGSTVSEIEADGFEIARRADIFKFGFGRRESAKTIGYTISLFTDLIGEEKPDLLLVLGDRYEIFAVVTAAAALSVPVAHISGGDVTLGAKDDYYRHCITKMSNLHFPSCADSARRVIQLGEEPGRVYNVGGLGDENIRNVPLMSLSELEKSLEFENLTPFFLITYHPETQKNTSPAEDMTRLLKALDRTDVNLIFTKSNADAGGDEINRMVDDYCQKNRHRAKAFYSLGLRRYLSAMKYARRVVGNSSSGVVETPSFKTPAVNIGDRQKGRYIRDNVICTSAGEEDIFRGLEKSLSPEFKKVCRGAKNPYYAGCVTSEKIVEIITDYLCKPHSTIKKFYSI